jgi:hypothetical protein
MRNEQQDAMASAVRRWVMVFGPALMATMAAQPAAACSAYQPFDLIGHAKRGHQIRDGLLAK